MTTAKDLKSIPFLIFKTFLKIVQMALNSLCRQFGIFYTTKCATEESAFYDQLKNQNDKRLKRNI